MMREILVPLPFVLALAAGCGGAPARQPNPTRAIDERRAVPIIAQAFTDESDSPAEGRDIRLSTGKSLRVDVTSTGHKYGVAYVTEADLAGLDAKADLPLRSSGSDLAVVQGSGPDSSA